MEESKTMVKTFEFTLLNGEKFQVSMNSRAPHSSRRTIALAIAENVVRDDGFYDPSQYQPTFLVGLFMFYADKQLPDMPIDQLMEFERNNHILKEVFNFMDLDDWEDISRWAEDMIEYRKSTLGKNSFDRAIEQLTAALKETVPQLLTQEQKQEEQDAEVPVVQ